MFYMQKRNNNYILPLLVTFQQRVFWMASLTELESLFCTIKKEKKIVGMETVGKLCILQDNTKGSITKTVPNWAWIYKLHRAPLSTEMQNYMHEKFPAADIL